MGRPPEDPMVTLRAMRALVAYAALLAMALVSSMSGAWASDSVGCHKTRPSPARRKFSSPEVDHFLLDTVPRLRDQIAQTFNVCLPNALDSTFVVAGRDDSFVITGDIDAMWLRDSTFQVLPYVRYFLKQGHRTELSDAVCGLVRRQARSVLIDRYANAFNLDARGSGGPHQGDRRVPKMTKAVFEGKYELDSLVAFFALSNEYLSRTGDAACFGSEWRDAVVAALGAMREQQRSSREEGSRAAYQFWRSEADLGNNGTGAPAARTMMVRSGFRPSDDPCALPFHVPTNLWLRSELKRLSETLSSLGGAEDSRKEALELSEEVGRGLRSHALVASPANSSELIFAYEVDGFGSRVIMDDANAPSLVSLPYLGSLETQEEERAYLATKRLALATETNPFFYEGAVGSGIGSPHKGYGMIWPLGVIYDLFGPEKTDGEILRGLDHLQRSTAGTNCMHESFWKDDASVYTRPWFAWANSAYGELILYLLRTRPHLVLRETPPPTVRERKRETKAR